MCTRCKQEFGMKQGDCKYQVATFNTNSWPPSSRTSKTRCTSSLPQQDKIRHPAPTRPTHPPNFISPHLLIASTWCRPASRSPSIPRNLVCTISTAWNILWCYFQIGSAPGNKKLCRRPKKIKKGKPPCSLQSELKVTMSIPQDRTCGRKTYSSCNAKGHRQQAKEGAKR